MKVSLKRKYSKAYREWKDQPKEETIIDAMLDLRFELLSNGWMPIDIERLHKHIDDQHQETIKGNGMNETMIWMIKGMQQRVAGNPHEYDHIIRRYAFWDGYNESINNQKEVELKKLVELGLFRVDWEGYYAITDEGLNWNLD
jgi:hypothetical protein